MLRADSEAAPVNAVISACGAYRYQLRRENLGASPMTIKWVMLNPSTADATADDPTIRRCLAFSRYWGAGQMFVCNLYAFRATRPRDMWAQEELGSDIIGPQNDYFLVNTPGDIVVFACGQQARPSRLLAVFELLYGLGPIYCLGENADKTPKHPLYLKNDTPLRAWQPA